MNTTWPHNVEKIPKFVVYITIHSKVDIKTSSKKYMPSPYLFTLASLIRLLRKVIQTLHKVIYTSLLVIHNKDIRQPHDPTT